MGFDALLGNRQLKENLTQSLRRGHTSHFYLISGPEGSGKHTLARLLAAALLCGGTDKPCLGCPACRKVMAGLHPDFITVDDTDKATVPVALIRQARDDMFIRPNEGTKKIYLFPRAQNMGLPGQNALLKVLEEPPPYGVFLLLTDNPERLLPTVRSRCVQLSLLPLPEATLRRELIREFPNAEASVLSAAIGRSAGFLGQAKALLTQPDNPRLGALTRAFAERDPLLLTRTLAPMEKEKRDCLIPLLQQWLEILSDALACRAGMPALSGQASRLAAARSGAELNAAADCLKKAIEYAQNNVSVAAICGYLQWALR